MGSFILHFCLGWLWPGYNWHPQSIFLYIPILTPVTLHSVKIMFGGWNALSRYSTVDYPAFRSIEGRFGLLMTPNEVAPLGLRFPHMPLSHWLPLRSLAMRLSWLLLPHSLLPLAKSGQWKRKFSAIPRKCSPHPKIITLPVHSGLANAKEGHDRSPSHHARCLPVPACVLQAKLNLLNCSCSDLSSSKCWVSPCFST